MTKEKKMETFDFGFGPVPAHKHANGGGWVADTAHVSESAYVGSDARVYGNARVCDNAWVYGDARVYGDALVCGDAWVCGNALVYDNAQVYGNALVCGNDKISRKIEIVFVSGFCFPITVTPQSITIGCQHKSHSEFLAVTKKMAIEMGLPADEYSAVKAIVKAAVKQVTRK